MVQKSFKKLFIGIYRYIKYLQVMLGYYLWVRYKPVNIYNYKLWGYFYNGNNKQNYLHPWAIIYKLTSVSKVYKSA